MLISKTRWSAAAAALMLLSGCTTPPSATPITVSTTAPPPGRPEAYQDTRLQYAILTDDKATLAKDFRTNPERTDLERGLTAVTLPFAAVTETLFWPAFHVLTHPEYR